MTPENGVMSGHVYTRAQNSSSVHLNWECSDGDARRNRQCFKTGGSCWLQVFRDLSRPFGRNAIEHQSRRHCRCHSGSNQLTCTSNRPIAERVFRLGRAGWPCALRRAHESQEAVQENGCRALPRGSAWLESTERFIALLRGSRRRLAPRRAADLLCSRGVPR